MSRVSSILAIFFALTSPVAVWAQIEPADGSNTLTLSDAEKADLLGQHTEASVDAARAGLGGSPQPDRAIHGEIGALVGSRGTRAAYGTATVPLGENSQATMSFERSRSDRPY